MNISVRTILPDRSIAEFVHSFWALENPSDREEEVVILPDGRIDLFFSRSATEPFHASLLGLGTHPEEAKIAPGTVTFAISFRLPAAEYILHEPVSGLLNQGKALPADFWDMAATDLSDLDQFCRKATQKILALLPGKTDSRKLRLFDLLYSTEGAIPVSELADRTGWSSRQINRYFNQQFGISLKAYAGILRFRASFGHIREGKLFPQQNFADQSHFIREVKKLSGALPKELKQNLNDRFIQLKVEGQKS